MVADHNSNEEDLDENQKRQLLNYILAKIFINDDLVDQLHQVEESKKENITADPIHHTPTPIPRFKALMDKISLNEDNDEG